MLHTMWKLCLDGLELIGFAICAWGALALVKDATVSEGGKKVQRAARKGWNFVVHWIAGFIAFAGGLILFASSLAGYLTHLGWVQGYVLPIGSIVLAVVVTACAIADVVGDGKPDKRAVVCALVLPTLLAVAVGAWPSSSGKVGHDGHNWQQTVQSRSGK
jgi:hypothetical protein